jgi:hypothetical protein
VVVHEEKPATEHMVYDLSVGGVRLCGLPRARIGDRVTVRLRLPGDVVVAPGRLLRAGTIARIPDLAIEFSDLSSRAEDSIHDAVVDALSRPEHRSILLIQEGRERCWPGWHWLDPISPICDTAATPLEALQHLATQSIRVGIVSASDRMAARFWGEIHPEIAWRALEEMGCLRSVR